MRGEVSPLIPGTTRPQTRPPEDPEWVSDKRLRREYMLPDETGQDVVVFLYTIGALSTALGKSPVTVRKWMRLRLIPEPRYRSANAIGTLGDAGRRLYTREQIETLVRIASEEGVLATATRTRAKRMSDTNFRARVWRVWGAKGWF